MSNNLAGVVATKIKSSLTIPLKLLFPPSFLPIIQKKGLSKTVWHREKRIFWAGILKVQSTKYKVFTVPQIEETN
jgi:hypothetical protein